LTRVEFERPELRGRYPSNLLLDEDVAAQLDSQTGILTSGTGAVKRSTAAGHQGTAYGKESRPVGTPNIEYGDSGGASRFFYCAKAPKSEKGKYNTHPTVKPLKLMEYLCKLTKTPTGGLVLDPFMGSGTTGIACMNSDRDFIGIEKEEPYYAIAVRRLEEASA
jgi:site-specific DNA-methyltransferase (adenine-specific)